MKKINTIYLQYYKSNTQSKFLYVDIFFSIVKRVYLGKINLVDE